MDTDLLILSIVVSWTGLFTNIISNMDPKFTLALWKDLYQLFGTKLSFTKTSHPQTNVLAERMIQTLKYMGRRPWESGLELKDCDVFTHHFFTLLPLLESAYKTSILASTNKTPAILEKGWNLRLPQYFLRKYLVEMNASAACVKGMLENSIKHAIRCMKDSFAYFKEKWDKSHATPDIKVGDLIPLSATNLINLKRCKNLKDSFSGTFFIKALHGENVFEVELS
ncbi:hypothetical protein O181_008314 [Austropuccinia psidii MF-1]|uniref:Integrase catalytic domain-containing protein n=1 Tax=Austropuccinia psidii MF-1 TaxID=1389203 RepID=A0A9Q3BME2_9BASI|nr:hypothetical protein [Austropuccinia psidii MF-1]